MSTRSPKEGEGISLPGGLLKGVGRPAPSAQRKKKKRNCPASEGEKEEKCGDGVE